MIATSCPALQQQDNYIFYYAFKYLNKYMQNKYIKNYSKENHVYLTGNGIYELELLKGN